MRIEPTLEEVVHGRRGMLSGIDACLRAQCIVSAASLMFATIDALAALTRPVESSRTTRDVFIRWVDTFLLPDSELPCTALDLYAARCGLLHTYSHVSTLQATGDASPIVFQWAAGPATDAELPLPIGSIVVVIEHLNRGLRAAIRRFHVAADTDPLILDRVRHHLKSLLCYRPAQGLVVVSAA